MNYVFGPVPSRRLGQSLGIDTIPLKTCNWNCVYCQLGRTMPLIHERKAYIPPEAILAEVATVLAQHAPGEIDWLTFVGSGEPTLHSGIGGLIREVQRLSALPVAVITNGSLLYLPEVRQDLATAAVVMPSLDAGTADLYRQLNRPHPEATFARLVEGMVAFRQMYRGKIWVEVMLMQGLNDTEPALRAISAVLRRIQPDEVHINLPTRPPAETWVRPSDEEGLLRAQAILGEIAHVVHPAVGEFDLSGCDTAVEAVIAIITRHPMRQTELEETLDHWAPGQVREALALLAESGRAQVVERLGEQFWSAAPAHYPDRAHSQAVAVHRRRGRDSAADPS